jgi:ABC-type Zn2+ transport system substrate-binding protein/surface adhesin
VSIIVIHVTYDISSQPHTYTPIHLTPHTSHTHTHTHIHTHTHTHTHKHTHTHTHTHTHKHKHTHTHTHIRTYTHTQRIWLRPSLNEVFDLQVPIYLYAYMY